jgi:hypothetical protein
MARRSAPLTPVVQQPKSQDDVESQTDEEDGPATVTINDQETTWVDHINRDREAEEAKPK